MSGRSWVIAFGLAFLVVGSCKNKDSGTVIGDDDDVSGDDDDDDDVVTTAEWGLDERPANPDCVAPDRPLNTASVALNRVFPSVSFSNAMVLAQSEDIAGFWYVAELDGEIRRFDDDPAVSSAALVLDISGRVATGSEAGLLGMAIHPDFANTGDLYVSYTAPGSPYISRVSRFHSDDGGATFDPGSEEVLISVNQPFSNHNGGNIAFGPDGFLYWGLGDGGSGGDPLDSGQDRGSMLGKLHRIDVDNGNPYGIPADNPFADGVNGLPEIYAWGLRNPFRFTFDPQNGDLWLGDVGQDAWEEIDKIELGGNYGWRVTEGLHCFSPLVGCETAGLIAPVVEYPNAGASVIAGVVYHGAEIPEITGTVLFIDYYRGDLYGVVYDQVTGEPEVATLSAGTGRNITGFATGLDTEAYAIDRYNGVYRLERNGGGGADPFPTLLSQTGCFESGDPATPTAGMIDYSINHPFWSDGADKERFIAIPDGTTITVEEDGDWTLPIGSVLAKHFRVGGALVETRLFMRHADGEWAGYAYEWDAGQTDATLLAGGKSLDAGGQDWTIPSRSECLQCHGQAAGGSLGPETVQMNHAHRYATSGLAANQIATFDHIGWFDASPGEASGLDTLPALDGTEPLEDRARAYLHANCAQCHRPGGNGRGNLDLRWDADDAVACDVNPEFGDLGVANAKIIAPGDVAASIMSHRVRSRGAYGMPPLGSHQVDEDGAQLIDDWIASLTGCP